MKRVATSLAHGLLLLAAACNDPAAASSDGSAAQMDLAATANDLSAAGNDLESGGNGPENPGETSVEAGVIDVSPRAEEVLPGGEDASLPSGDLAADGADVTAETSDLPPDASTDAGPTCPAWQPFDYKCDPKQPATCPGGLCTLLTKQCIGPKLDPHRWDDCSDGTCQPCEAQKGCPVDCGPKPTFTGSKQYSGDKTLVVWVHGFSNQGPDKLKDLVYGSDKGCGDVLQAMQGFGVKAPCGNTPATAKDPTHLVGVEYYGSKPASWMTPQDVAEVEKWPYSGGATGLQRYATIVAKFVQHRMAVSGATHAMLACHSMGCLISRHLLENDYSGLTSGHKIVRWFTSTGVIDGAQLSRLFDNPAIQQGAKALGLELSDFILMNPDYVWDVTAAWDHKLYLANNPLLGGILIHHVGATDAKIKQALGVQLLDLNNPDDAPNDGIMYTADQYFHGQDALVACKSKAGVPVAPTHSYVYADHMAAPESKAAGLLATAALYHKRKVRIALVESELLQSQEGLLDPAPDELALEVDVRFDPFVKDTWKQDVLVHEAKVAHRSADAWTQKAGTKTALQGVVVFEGPVLDGMDKLKLDLKVAEVDWYPRWKVKEVSLKPASVVGEFHGFVGLQPGAVVPIIGKAWQGKLAVDVFEMD